MPGTSEKRARIEQETSEKRARSERETSEKRARSLGALAQFPAYQQSAPLRPSQRICSLSGRIQPTQASRGMHCAGQRNIRRESSCTQTRDRTPHIPSPQPHPAGVCDSDARHVRCGPGDRGAVGNTVRVTAHEPGRRPARRASSFPRLGGGRRQDSDGADPRHSRRDSETLRPGGGSKPDQEARARVRAGPSTRIADLTGPLSAGPAVRPST